MQKWLTSLMMVLSISIASFVNANGQLVGEIGYRQDNIHYKRAFNSSPFKLNRKFKDLNIIQIGVKGDTTFCGNVYVRGSAHFGWIVDGNVKRNIEIAGSNSATGPSTPVNISGRDKNLIDGRFVFDIDAAIGYPFYLCDCTMTLTPVIGYSFDSQNLRLEDNALSLNGLPRPIEISDGCCCTSKFINRWYGPFIGIDLNYRPYEGCWQLFANLEYHIARATFRSHDVFSLDGKHDNHTRYKHAHGWKFDIGANYLLNACSFIGLTFNYLDFSASKHRHHDSFSNSDLSDIISSSGRTKHHNDWRSYAISLAYGYQF